MSGPPGVSLSKHGLHAPDGLECPEGGTHHILEPEIIIAAAAGGGTPTCRKCRQPVRLESLTHLEG